MKVVGKIVKGFILIELMVVMVIIVFLFIIVVLCYFVYVDWVCEVIL